MCALRCLKNRIQGEDKLGEWHAPGFKPMVCSAEFVRLLIVQVVVLHGGEGEEFEGFRNRDFGFWD